MEGQGEGVGEWGTVDHQVRPGSGRPARGDGQASWAGHRDKDRAPKDRGKIKRLLGQQFIVQLPIYLNVCQEPLVWKIVGQTFCQKL